MRGRELIPVAQRLARVIDEPHVRSAVNRAYYAAYTELVHYAGRNGYVHSSGRGSHRRAWEFVGSLPDSDISRRAERSAIRSQGLLLKQLRTKAGYQPFLRLAQADGGDAVRAAEGIVGALDRLIP
jgi:hypothetical protein